MTTSAHLLTRLGAVLLVLGLVSACAPAAAPAAPTAKPAPAATTAPAATAKPAAPAAPPAPTAAPAAPTAAPAAKVAPTTAPAAATDFPSGDITIINPFPSGNYEVQLRVFAPILQSKLPKPVRVGVENVAGAGGVIGYNKLVEARPDGLSLSATSTHSDAVRKLDRADTAKWEPTDWIWIGGWFSETPAVGVRKSFGPSSWEEMAKEGKANRVTFATPGKGSLNHGQMMLVAKIMGINVKFVHYPSTAEARTALARGEADAYLAPASTIGEWVDAGELKWIAILRDGPDPLFPGVPSLRDVGVSAADKDKLLSMAGSIRGIITNKGVPADRVQVLREAFWQAANDSQWTEALKKDGITSEPMRGDQVQAFVAKFWPDFKESWGQLVASE